MDRRAPAFVLFVASLAPACSAPRPASAPAPAKPPEVKSHLVAHYTFDDCSAKDTSGNRHDGVIHGKPGCVDGPVGKAMSFDGAHDYFTVAPIPGDPLAVELTVTGWVKGIGFGNPGSKWVTVLTIGNTSIETPFAVAYMVDGQGRFFPYTRITSATGQVALRLLDKPAGSEGVWSFFAWSYNRGLVKIYENATLVAAYDAAVPQLSSTTEPIDVGRDVPGATEYLQGALDDLRLYDCELPPAELRQLMDLGLGRRSAPRASSE